MKKLVLLLLLVCFSMPLMAQDPELSLPESVNRLADDVSTLLIQDYSGSDTKLLVRITPFTRNGREVPLGSLFATVLAGRLSATGSFKVLTNETDELLERELNRVGIEYVPELPAYVVNGEVFVEDEVFHVVANIVSVEDQSQVGSIEHSFAMTENLEDLLRSQATMTMGGAEDDYEPDSMDNPNDIDFDEPMLGHTIFPGGDEDWYVFQADEGETLMVTIATSGSTDTYISVFGPDNSYSEIASNDDTDGSNARVQFSAESGAEYYVMVRGYSGETTGAYTLLAEMEELVLEDNEPNDRIDQATELAVGQTMEVGLVPSYDVDFYHLDIAESGSDSVFVVETHGNTDTVMELLDQYGNSISSNDDGGTDNNALISFFPEEGNEYYVSVSHYDGSSTGFYAISLRAMSMPNDPTEPNNTLEQATPIETDGPDVTGSFFTSDDQDWYVFTIDEGTNAGVETFGTIDTYITVYDSRMNVLREDDDSGRDYNALVTVYLQAGTYYVKLHRVGDAGRANETYSLRVYSGADPSVHNYEEEEYYY